VLVHEDIAEEFTLRLDKTVRDAPVGDPSAEVVYGPMLSQRFADRFEEYLTWIQPHHRLLGSPGTGRITAQNPRPGFVGDPDVGLYYHPVVVAGVREQDALFREETFGPIVCLATYRDLAEAIRLANAPGYGLSSSIFTRDPAEAFRFRRGISAGMVSVNNSTSGAEAHLPFGGNGKSGNGSRQSGMWVLDQFTRWQSMNWDYSGTLQKAQMDIAELIPDESFRLGD
jgi:aldehyde dehydrogenase (NAD+)